MSKYIYDHHFPDDLKTMNEKELELLSYEIRDFLIEKVSKTGGHLSSNLGVVEIAIALHKVFDTPKDKIIWDVGHQSYVHKILTGRAEGFDHLRQLDGMSGFPKQCESEFDVFDTGHSSSSISLGLGLAEGRDLRQEDYHVISVIGDGALTGGMAFEALNNAGNMNTDLIVLLNDNGMSISANTGGLPKYLRKLRSSEGYLSVKSAVKRGVSKVPVIGEGMVAGIHNTKEHIKYAMLDGAFFEELGFMYLGPVDGHNISELCEALEEAKRIDGPVFVHAITVKGKGYSKAEELPNVFHGIGPFDMETGTPVKKKGPMSYSAVFGSKLCEMARKDNSITAISAAMIDGVGLNHFKEEFPDRIFDVGIAEGHAISFAAGLAKAGSKPYVAIYSTFLQRGYDQIMEDICLQNLPVTLCVDRAGVVGADGETHHGLFDIAYLKSMPHMHILAPANRQELEEMLELSQDFQEPCAIRYPRGAAEECPDSKPVIWGRAQRLQEGTDLDIWALGTTCQQALKAAEQLKEKGISAGVVNARFADPIDRDLLLQAASQKKMIATLEDGVLSGGFGESVGEIIKDEPCRVISFGWPEKFIEHGSAEELRRRYGLDSTSIAERICSEIER